MKMKKIFTMVNSFILGVFCFTPLISSAFESEPYKNKELIPGQPATSDFIQYLDSLYNFSIAIAAILAIFMISLGAFNYIFTAAGNASKILDAKDMIKNALIGLVLVLAASLILFIVNPDLVSGTILGPQKVIESITTK